MDTRKGLSKELSREWNMHMKLNTGVCHLKNRRKLNNRGMGTVEMILIIVVLIGLISHVPELSEKIPDQIRIHKTNTGSYAEVVIQ